MEQEDFNIREHQLTSKERDFENALRPLSFEDFSGQDKVVENLRIFVKAARLRGEALDHVLLHGPPGLGKTTLSNIIANELGVGFKVTSGPVLDKPGDLAGVDLFDVTPYFTFTDNDLSLLGNIKGYVVIGNSLRGPKYDYPTYDLDEVVSATRAAEPTPIEPGFKGFKDASLTIKNGKYKSTMTIGRIVNGNSFAVEFKTKKKQLFWKKSVKAGYSAMLTMKSSKFNYKNTVFCPYGKEVSILNLPIERVGNVFDAVVENFKSSRGDAKGNQSFHNIRVI